MKKSSVFAVALICAGGAIVFQIIAASHHFDHWSFPVSGGIYYGIVSLYPRLASFV